jgi:hypothetical protein
METPSPFEMTTTSGTPNGAGGAVLSLVSLLSPNGCILKMTSRMETDFKTIVTFDLVSSLQIIWYSYNERNL